MEFGLGAGVGVVAEQQVQHRHEVRLAGAEAALQEDGLGRVVADGGGDEAERLVEGLGELVGDDVLVDGGRRCSAADALGELEDEVAVLDLVGDRR